MSSKSTENAGSEDHKSPSQRDDPLLHYYQSEYNRMHKALHQETNKVVKRPERRHMPDVNNTLLPYADLTAYRYNLRREQGDLVYLRPASRETSGGLCDPWVSYSMDSTITPRQPAKHSHSQPDSRPTSSDKKSRQNSPRSAPSGTRSPLFPIVTAQPSELSKKEKLYYTDVPALRAEFERTYHAHAERRVQIEYERTKQEFYARQLDKMDEYHPSTRPRMRAAYFAYLQNNPGSKKAVYECVRQVEKGDDEKQSRK